MKNFKIAFYDAKPYDIDFFNKANQHHHFQINYIQSHLTVLTAELARDHDAVCIFVNDIVTEEIINIFVKNNIKIVALRSAGFNNVDLN